MPGKLLGVEGPQFRNVLTIIQRVCGGGMFVICTTFTFLNMCLIKIKTNSIRNYFFNQLQDLIYFDHIGNDQKTTSEMIINMVNFHMKQREHVIMCSNMF